MDNFSFPRVTLDRSRSPCRTTIRQTEYLRDLLIYIGKLPRRRNAGSLIAEKNPTRKLADQARSRTPRYCIGVRAYECGFPRRTLLGNLVNRSKPVLFYRGRCRAEPPVSRPR